MFDLQLLALQGDITRVITFQLAREASKRTYPEIGVPEPHHPITHHGNNPEKLAKVAKINQFHVSLFAEFLEKLKATPEGEGSLLDHSLYLYGSGMGTPTPMTIRTCRSWSPAARRVICRADDTFVSPSRRLWPICI